MLKRIGAEESGEFKAVASGTLPSGRPVVVNSDGTVSVVSEDSASQSLGSATDFDTDTNTYLEASVVHDPDQNKIIIAYRDNGNSNRGTAIVGTVSGTSISFGTPVVFYDGGASGESSFNSIVYDSSNDKVVISFRGYNGSASTCQSIVGTVSGTSISFGSAATFSSDSANYIHSTFDSSNNKVVIVFRDEGNSRYGTAIVGTVSGTSISFGSEVVFESATASYPQCVFDSSNNKVVVAYRDEDNSDYGTAIIGTVSGTSISFGTPVVYHSARADLNRIAFDSTNNKVVIAFRDNGDNEKGKALVGTVSGTSISFGSTVTFSTAGTRIDFPSLSYNVEAQKFIVTYRQYVDASAVLSSELNEGTVSGTSISFGSSIKFADRADHTASAYDSTNKLVVIAFQDFTDSKKGAAIIFQSAFTSTTLTSENYIGMSRGTAFQTGSADSLGSETEFITTMGNEVSNGVYDPDSNKVVLAYTDSDNSTRGTAIVGTVSGTSISFGTPAVFNSGTTEHIGITYDTTNDKVVIVYEDAGNSSHGTAIVGTVSGTSISFGSEAVYNTATTQFNVATFDANTGKVVIIYQDTGGAIQSKVATVSGTSISFGSEVQVGGSNSNYTAVVFDSNSNKVVVVFRDGSNSNYGTARVGTVSGTDISYGTAAVFNSGSSEDIHCAFDSSNNKVVIGYKDGGDSDKGNCVVGTVSGTSISFGSEVTFHNASTNGMDDVVYNSNLGKVFFFYKNATVIGKVVSGTVSGTAVGSLSSEFTYHNASTAVSFQVYDVASTNIVAAYRDAGDSNKGKAVVFKPDNIATTRGEVADGGNASMDIIGSVSDNQIGLTAGQQYFVQNDGTISTTADSPSVLAGTAISATELVVKT